MGRSSIMSASRLRDLIAHCIGSHRDVDAVQFSRSAFVDRLGLNVRDIDGATWRIWIAKDPWSRTGGDR